MKYRRFGKTDLVMPVLSFGCMRSMHAWPDNASEPIPDRAQQTLTALVDQALAHGITHIETARGYGSSERQLGHILPRYPRADLIVQTKVIPDEDPEAFIASVKNSLQLLRLSHVDLLAIHGINDYRTLWYTCRKGGCLAAARTLQRQGLIRHVGFSGHGSLDVITQALEHREDDGFDFINVHWYYILDINRPAIDLALSKDLGVFIISPNDKGGHLYKPSTLLQEYCQPLSPMLFNDLWCLSYPGVSTISIGAADPNHFDEHLKVLPLLDTGSRAELNRIDGLLKNRMVALTGHERPDALWNKLPSWDQAPGNINMAMIIWLHNLSRGWDMHSYAQARYRMLGEGSSWVPGNNAAITPACDLSSLPAIDGMPPDIIRSLLTEAHRDLHAPEEKQQAAVD